MIHAFTRSIHQQGKKAFYIAQLYSLAISQLVISHQLLLQVANNHLRDLREQGWCSGESACLPPMCPRFNSRTRCHVWVEFVVGSLLCSKRFFFGYPSFPLFLKTNISKFQFDLGMHEHFWMSSCELLGAMRVNKLHLHLQLHLHFTYTFTLINGSMFLSHDPPIIVTHKCPVRAVSKLWSSLLH